MVNCLIMEIDILLQTMIKTNKSDYNGKTEYILPEKLKDPY